MGDPQISVAGRRRSGRSLNSLAIQLSAFALTFILIALLVVTSSRAAFVAQNDNTTNQVTSAAIALTDTDSGTAMFNGVTNLMPGAPVERCIDVTYTGTVDPTAVLLYANAAPTGTLTPYLNLTVQMGTDNTPVFGDCAGFTSGATTWNPIGSPETRTFRFEISVQDVTAAAGKSSTFGFSWETRTS